MYNVELTEEYLENVKHVLFGNQKQANVINDSVTYMVAGMLAELTSAEFLTSEEAVTMSIHSYLEDAARGAIRPNETFVLLTAGKQSLECLQMEGEKQADVTCPNPESPKHLFRIHMVGEDPDTGILDLPEQNMGTVTDQFKISEGTGRPHVEDRDITWNKDETAAQRVERLTKMLAPLCPTAVAGELGGDEKSMAIYAAEYYYANK